VEWDVAKEEREGKERGEIQNEDGREIGWMKEIWRRGKMIEKEREEWGIGIKNVIFMEFLGIVILCLFMFMCIYFYCIYFFV
jgi:hypothetical protein